MPGTRKLGRTSAHRKAMLRGLVTYLLEEGKVETTLTRAKEVRSVAEKMITLGKKNTLASYRQALAYITKEDVAKKVFSVIAPAYADVNGGYTQVYKMGPRRGDGAETAIVKLVAVKASAEESK
jgi:large subunit ribosomal protein L17